MRELERRQLGASPSDSKRAHKESAEPLSRERPVRVDADLPMATSEQARQPLDSKTNRRSGGGKREVPPAESVGYLSRHIEDDEEDRRIRELEREVECLQTMGSVGRQSERPRAVSANLTRKRPPAAESGRQVGDGTPSSVSSRRSASAGRPSRPTKKLSNAQQVRPMCTRGWNILIHA